MNISKETKLAAEELLADFDAVFTRYSLKKNKYVFIGGNTVDILGTDAALLYKDPRALNRIVVKQQAAKYLKMRNKLKSKNKISETFTLVTKEKQKKKIKIEAKLVKDKKGAPQFIDSLILPEPVSTTNKRGVKQFRDLKRQKSGLISAVSHEFKTPLATILSSVELLNYYIDNRNDEKERIVLERVKRSAGSLVTIIENYLHFEKSSFEKMKVHLTGINIRKFINVMIEDIAVNLSSRHFLNVNIDLKTEIISTNEVLLRQALINVINNAIKFSPSGGQIFISIYSDNDVITFEIKDEGIGIPDEEIKNITQPFFRASNSELIEGSGLGMAIVKNSVKLLNGKFNIESSMEKGTIVTIVLPLKVTNGGKV